MECFQNQAKSQVSMSRYEIKCFTADGCSAGFSTEARQQLLEPALLKALDRIEQNNILQISALEGLAQCPFCPYAEIYPPIDVDREFRCQSPDCMVVSCRQCRLKTHIPMSCEEVVKKNSELARLQVEEAMSTALIRRCNKCRWSSGRFHDPTNIT